MTEKKSDFEKWFKDWSILGKHCKKENKFVAISQLKTAGFTILSPAELAELLADYDVQMERARLEASGLKTSEKYFKDYKDIAGQAAIQFLKQRGVGK